MCLNFLDLRLHYWSMAILCFPEIVSWGVSGLIGLRWACVHLNPISQGGTEGFKPQCGGPQILKVFTQTWGRPKKSSSLTKSHTDSSFYTPKKIHKNKKLLFSDNFFSLQPEPLVTILSFWKTSIFHFQPTVAQ